MVKQLLHVFLGVGVWNFFAPAPSSTCGGFSGCEFRLSQLLHGHKLGEGPWQFWVLALLFPIGSNSSQNKRTLAKPGVLFMKMLQILKLFQRFIQCFHLPAVRFRDAAVSLQRRVPGNYAALC